MSCSRLAGLRVAEYSAGLRSWLLRYCRIWENRIKCIAEAFAPSCQLTDKGKSAAIGKGCKLYKVRALRCYQQNGKQ